VLAVRDGAWRRDRLGLTRFVLRRSFGFDQEERIVDLNLARTELKSIELAFVLPIGGTEEVAAGHSSRTCNTDAPTARPRPPMRRFS
jgi:hypothetical protein